MNTHALTAQLSRYIIRDNLESTYVGNFEESDSLEADTHWKLAQLPCHSFMDAVKNPSSSLSLCQ